MTKQLSIDRYMLVYTLQVQYICASYNLHLSMTINCSFNLKKSKQIKQTNTILLIEYVATCRYWIYIWLFTFLISTRMFECVLFSICSMFLRVCLTDHQLSSNYMYIRMLLLDNVSNITNQVYWMSDRFVSIVHSNVYHFDWFVGNDGTRYSQYDRTSEHQDEHKYNS
jgi:hypothetical protein